MTHSRRRSQTLLARSHTSRRVSHMAATRVYNVVHTLNGVNDIVPLCNLRAPGAAPAGLISPALLPCRRVFTYGHQGAHRLKTSRTTISPPSPMLRPSCSNNSITEPRQRLPPAAAARDSCLASLYSPAPSIATVPVVSQCVTRVSHSLTPHSSPTKLDTTLT